MYLQNFKIINKTALVTGAGKGIGKASAIALAEAGANLIILSRTKSDLDNVEKQIRKLKRKCKSYICDVSNYDDVKNVFNKVSSFNAFNSSNIQGSSESYNVFFPSLCFAS